MAEGSKTRTPLKREKLQVDFSEVERLRLENNKLHDEVKELHQLLNQSQQLELKQTEKIELLESKVTPKRNVWARLFGK